MAWREKVGKEWGFESMAGRLQFYMWLGWSASEKVTIYITIDVKKSGISFCKYGKRSIPGRGKSKYEDVKVGVRLQYSRNSKETTKAVGNEMRSEAWWACCGLGEGMWETDHRRPGSSL